MRNKTQLTFIVLMATVFFVAGCSVPHRGERVAARQVYPQSELEQRMNDRSSWIDVDPAKNF
jgi:hypothetical protein